MKRWWSNGCFATPEEKNNLSEFDASYLAETLIDGIKKVIDGQYAILYKGYSENIQDEELAIFYRELMISEANHYTSFLQFAHELAEEGYDVKIRWEEWLEFEAKVIESYGKSETIHG